MLENILLNQKQYSLHLRKESLDSRLEHLKSLEKCLKKYTEDIICALSADFCKPETESILSEILPVLEELQLAKKNLKKWARHRAVKTPITLFGTKSFIKPEPRGVCLIIGPWNYPFQLVLIPLISAIAAGNCVILKPSEITKQTSLLIKKIIDEVFAAEHVKVIEGGAETVQELLKFPFDHIFFTGSTQVGKIIMAAASKHLSSITLELGGKSPVIVDSSADIKLAAKKIAWGKCFNAGQTCIAPDYVFVQKSILGELRTELISAMNHFYGDTPEGKRKNPDFARVVNTHHTERMSFLLRDAKEKNAVITFGGEADIPNRYISPTIIEKIDPHSSILHEEIFGPLLPLVVFADLDSVIHQINEKDKPLALYVFSQSDHNINKILNETTSGGVCINDCLLHIANSHLPFGGIGASGMGNYHGHYGFKTFSHEKAILRQSRFGKMMQVMYPPYAKNKTAIIKRILNYFF